MIRLLQILPLLAFVSCGSDPAAPALKAHHGAEASASVPPAGASEAEQEGSADAAETLRNYYHLIERGDFEAAVRLRSDRETAAKRLADNFRTYESYRVQVGLPSRPVHSGEYLFVEVPVMITGSYKSGKTFGSGGQVTMRRPVESGRGGWRVFTG